MMCVLNAMQKEKYILCHQQAERRAIEMRESQHKCIYGQNAMARVLRLIPQLAFGNQAVRSPDASWVLRWRYDQLTEREQERFLPLCPDFAIELKSPSDTLSVLKRKMDEYIENGLQLGWLIEPKQKTVHIYRPHLPVEIRDNPNTLSADPILPGFILDLTEIW